MQVIHEHNGQQVVGEAASAMLLLTNKKGNFFSTPAMSKYNGLIHWDSALQTYCKSIEQFTLSGNVVEVINRIHEVERRYEHGAIERFHLSNNALHYEVEGYKEALFLDLDMRRLDDYSTNGRHYDVKMRDGKLVIHYQKADVYEQVLVIEGIPEEGFTLIGEWQERHYPYDARRGDGGGAWIYRVGRIAVPGKLSLLITHSSTEEKALRKAAYATAHKRKFFESSKAYVKNAYKTGMIEADLALAALDSLVTKGDFTGILAGLPWFTQYWSRDELISLGALIKSEQYSLVKDILVRYYELLERGLLPAQYPKDGNNAIDSLGWLAKRTLDLLRALEGNLKEYFTRIELAYLRDRMAHAVDWLEKERGCPVTNAPGETWMDAVVDGYGREGARIEVQAGQLCCLSLLSFLEQKTRRLPMRWKRHRRECVKELRERFYRDGKVADGLIDDELEMTQRPNLFLAYYLAPDLLSPEEWRAAFDYALEKLWLPWGGLSSLSRYSRHFHGHYTGSDDRSYHNGDSWYWVNCLAAICLQRIDKERYASYISHLRDAAVNDLLWQGALGHASELSSADEQEWGGTFSQAWSAAMLYELLMEFSMDSSGGGEEPLKGFCSI